MSFDSRGLLPTRWLLHLRILLSSYVYFHTRPSYWWWIMRGCRTLPRSLPYSPTPRTQLSQKPCSRSTCTSGPSITMILGWICFWNFSKTTPSWLQPSMVRREIWFDHMILSNWLFSSNDLCNRTCKSRVPMFFRSRRQFGCLASRSDRTHRVPISLQPNIRALSTRGISQRT